MRRHATLFIVVLTMFGSVAVASAQETPPTPPNLVVIITDDMRFDLMPHMPTVMSELVGRPVGSRAEEERVAPVDPRPRRGHLDPPGLAGAAERVRRADGDRAAGARRERHAAACEVEDRLALEDVEARLERVEVLVDVTVRERDDGERHVRRAERPVDQPARRQAARSAR